MGLLHLLGRQSLARDAADLWFRPLTSYSVAGEDAGAFGTVCKPIGADAKKSDTDLLQVLKLHLHIAKKCYTSSVTRLT